MRKVSVDSVSDPETDDLLRVLYDLAFRRRSPHGWLTAAAISLVPAWIAMLCLRDGNIIGGTVFIGAVVVIFSMRLYCLRRGAAYPDESRSLADTKHMVGQTMRETGGIP